MAILGRVETIEYVAKNFKSGLTGIVAYAYKPGLIAAGIFPMVEIPSIIGSGIYTFDFLTSPTDPEGTYTFITLSPNEGNFRAHTKIDFFNPQSAASQQVGAGFTFNLRSSINSFDLISSQFASEMAKLASFSFEAPSSPSMSLDEESQGFSYAALGTQQLSMDVQIVEEGL